MKLLKLLMLPAAGLSLIGPIFAGGVTVFTHGFNSDVDGWIIPMADQSTGQSNFPGTNLTCYVIKITGSDPNYQFAVTRVDNPAGSNPSPNQNDSGEIVVKLDWSDVSNDGATNSTDVATQAVEALTTNLTLPDDLGRPLAELPIHLLGHSRGSSVVSEIARLLGEKGIWVDQMTLWDPVDSTFNDATIGVWENVLFADNYYQTLGEFLDPQGRPVSGCYNRQLTNLSGGYTLFPGAHGDVHLWYHGTVELGAGAFDGNHTITSGMRSSWYAAAETEGATGGFHYSRIAGGDRLSLATPAGTGTAMIIEGYNGMWDLGAGLSANRNSLPAPVDPWPNVIIARRATTGSFKSGDPLPLQIHYQSEVTGVGDPTLSILLDPDPNPWNGNEIPVSSQVVAGSGFNSILSISPAPSLPPGTDGTFYVLTRISEDGRTRQHHLRDPIQINPLMIPPEIVADSLRFESGQLTFTIVGRAGQEVTVEASSTLDDWVGIATLTLEADPRDFSDADSIDLDRRFYRLAYQPGL